MKASEQKFAELSEYAKDGVVIVQDGICKSANKATSQILGYSSEEFKGKRFFEWFPSKGKEILAQRHKQRIAGEEVPASLKTKVLHKNGNIKDIEFSSAVVQFEGRAAEMGIIQDISDLKSLEEALKKSEANYQTLVDNMNEITFMINPGGKFTFINPAITRQFGYTHEDVIGKSFSEFIHSDDIPKFETNLKNTLEGNYEPLELRFLDKEGKFRDLRISSNTMKENNSPVGILGISTDITERKNAVNELNLACQAVENTKTQLKAIIDNAPKVAIQGFNEKGKSFSGTSTQRNS